MKKNINHKRIRTFIYGFAFVISILCTSQCFAQSSTKKDTKASSFQYMKKLNNVFDYVQQNYVDEIDPSVLYEGALKGMLEALEDPYTLYLDSDYMRDLQDTTAGNFGGVGLSISKPLENKADKPAYVEVAYPIDDSPGAKAGIQAGDLLIAVEGQPTDEMSMNDVLDVLRGEIGTPVTVTVQRGANMKFDVKLVRALIEVPTAKYGMIEGTKTGYVRLIEFTPETPNRLQDALDSFEQEGFDSLIIDVRDNPGGLITSVVNVVDKFIDEGVIVSTKSRVLFENHEFLATPDKTTFTKKVPIVILINRGSASASEILSGALKDYHLAYLVGEKTYGKGSVQQVIPLSNTDGFKMTTARYYTPSDVNIDKIGIPPDLEIKNFFIPKEQEDVYVKLVESGELEKLAKENSNMTEAEIAKAAEELAKTYPIDLRILRRLIRVQAKKAQSAALYDMDYDIQLQEALKIVQRPDFFDLVKNTKTLKELQEEAEQKAAETQEEE